MLKFYIEYFSSNGHQVHHIEVFSQLKRTKKIKVKFCFRKDSNHLAYEN